MNEDREHVSGTISDESVCLRHWVLSGIMSQAQIHVVSTENHFRSVAFIAIRDERPGYGVERMQCQIHSFM